MGMWAGRTVETKGILLLGREQMMVRESGTGETDSCLLVCRTW